MEDGGREGIWMEDVGGEEIWTEDGRLGNMSRGLGWRGI